MAPVMNLQSLYNKNGIIVRVARGSLLNTDNNDLNVTFFEENRPIYLTTTFGVNYFSSFINIGAVISHLYLCIQLVALGHRWFGTSRKSGQSSKICGLTGQMRRMIWYGSEVWTKFKDMRSNRANEENDMVRVGSLDKVQRYAV